MIKKANRNTTQKVVDNFNIKELIEFERFCIDNYRIV
jgi:hypothetical protein